MSSAITDRNLWQKSTSLAPFSSVKTQRATLVPCCWAGVSPHKPRTRPAGQAGRDGGSSGGGATHRTALHRTAGVATFTLKDSVEGNPDQHSSVFCGWVISGVGELSVRAVSAQSPECPGERGAQSTAASRRLPHRLVLHSGWCRKNDSDALHPGLLSHSGELWVCPSFPFWDLTHKSICARFFILFILIIILISE